MLSYVAQAPRPFSTVRWLLVPVVEARRQMRLRAQISLRVEPAFHAGCQSRLEEPLCEAFVLAAKAGHGAFGFGANVTSKSTFHSEERIVTCMRWQGWTVFVFDKMPIVCQERTDRRLSRRRAGQWPISPGSQIDSKFP